MHKKTRGFTTIELLIAIAVFAVTIPALAAGINQLNVTNNRSRDLALANSLAESKAEELRNNGFNSLTPGTYTFSSELPNSLPPPKSASYTVSNPEPGIAEINISISYKDYSNTQTLQYRTLVSELGVGQ